MIHIKLNDDKNRFILEYFIDKADNVISIYLENNSSMKDTIINIVRNKNINKNNKKKELINYLVLFVDQEHLIAL